MIGLGTILLHDDLGGVLDAAMLALSVGLPAFLVAGLYSLWLHNCLQQQALEALVFSVALVTAWLNNSSCSWS